MSTSSTAASKMLLNFNSSLDDKKKIKEEAAKSLLRYILQG